MGSVTHSSNGQKHDRILEDEFSMSGMLDAEGGGPGPSAFDITAGQKMISAMSGSLLTSMLVTPLDVVRVRLQSQKPPTSPLNISKLTLTTHSLAPAQAAELGVTACCREVFFAGNTAEYCLAAPRIEGITVNHSSSIPADCVVQEVQKKTYNSTFDGLRKIARNEGFYSLWRGLSPTLVMAVPANIIYFTGYEWLRYNPVSPYSRLSNDSAPLIAGASARLLAVSAVSPIELVKTRMQAAPGGTTTNHLVEASRMIKDTIKTHGYTSLWRGLSLTLWRDVPFSGLYWWGYESIRARLTDYREDSRGRSLSRDGGDNITQARRRSQSRENHTETFVDSFTAGALSGTFASIVTMPFDVGKTRTQVYHEVAQGSQAPEQQNMVRLLWHIFKTEGAAGLWRGWIPRTMKVAPACAIMISSYEVGKRAFRGVNERAYNKRVQDV